MTQLEKLELMNFPLLGPSGLNSLSQKMCKLFRNKTKTKLKQKLAYCVYINTYLCRPKLILFEDVAYSASEKPSLAITPQLPGRLFSPSDISKTFYCIFELIWVPMTTT